MGGREVVIVDAVRTPVGRGHPEKGWYRNIHPANLLAKAYLELLVRSGVDAGEVGQVITGCVQQIGEQSFNIGRHSWLQAGLPVEVAGCTVDLQCGSAQQATNLGAALIAAEVDDLVIASGVEHMGRISFADGDEVQERHGHAITPELLARHDIRGQGIGAELIAEQYGISRDAMDRFGLRSHQLAAVATRGGAFAREMVPIEADGELRETDQGIRAGADLEALAALRPVFKENGRITAGTSSQISDGAAALMLASAEKAEQLGLRPRARIVDQVTVGCDPVKMLEGPIPATERILERNGLKIDEIDRFEVNEAFASVVLAWEKTLEPNIDHVNVRGGAIAIGHPLGSSGARLIATMLGVLEDENQQTGLVTMCCGGGVGTATLVELL